MPSTKYIIIAALVFAFCLFNLWLRRRDMLPFQLQEFPSSVNSSSVLLTIDTNHAFTNHSLLQQESQSSVNSRPSMLKLQDTNHSFTKHSIQQRSDIVKGIDNITFVNSTLNGKQPPTTDAEDIRYIWRTFNSSKVPSWAKDYFDWHVQQRQLLTEENKDNFRFLVVTCLNDQPKCGGTSDRLQPLPAFLRIAFETNRILLFQWERPVPLESFLVPPVGGIDWTVPEWLKPTIKSSKVYESLTRLVKEAKANNIKVIFRAKIQTHDMGSSFYNGRHIEVANNETRNINFFEEHYHALWSSLFTPAPPVANLIQKALDELNLAPGKYSFAHLRAGYGFKEEEGGARNRPDQEVEEWTERALNCLSTLHPGGPYFFASDSKHAKDYSVHYGRKRNVSVSFYDEGENEHPLHIDKASLEEHQNHASKFYSVFVDFYLMSMGKCMAHNLGNYGKWAYLISPYYRGTCRKRFWTPGLPRKRGSICNWTEPLLALSTHQTT